MPHRIYLRYAAALLLLVGTSALTPSVAHAQPTASAHYRVHFESTWSADTHPIAFPANPHFSPLVGALHDANVEFWSLGGFASPGMEQMAERGQTSPLDFEIAEAMAAGHASRLLIGPNLRPSPGRTALDFTATLDHSRVTLVTMLAPSPDWFVGVTGLDLLEQGAWVERKVVTLYALDAGTDSGTTYAARNRDTQPREPIDLVDDPPFAAGTAVGSFTFVRQRITPGPPLLLRANRFAIQVLWRDFVGNRGIGIPAPLTPETGFFWFFRPSNVELIAKVIDGCANNGHYWVFVAGLTNLGIEITVEDLKTGAEKHYSSDLNTPFRPIQDTAAFATCP